MDRLASRTPNTANLMDRSSSAPTHVHHVIIAAATLAAMLLYLERVCIAVAGDYIREDLGLTVGQMGLAFGMFFWAYALGQVPSGWLTDRFGPRRMMTLYLIGWSVFGIAIALSFDLWTLLLARFLLGLSQAGAYPTLAVLVKRWVPEVGRGLANSVVAFGGRVGGAAANLLTAVLIVAFVPLDTPARLAPSDLLDPARLHEQLNASVPAELLPVREKVRSVVQDQLHRRDGEDNPQQLCAALNALIDLPGAFDNLPASAATLSRDGVAIRVKPVEARSHQESERLNRLVLEQAFPGSLRQLHTAGWRPALFVYGLAGVFVALLFFWIVRDRPERHPWCNAAEVEQIEQGEMPAVVPRQTSIPWQILATNANLWLFSLCQFFTNIGWVFVITLMPSYLAEVFHVPIEERGLMTTLPLFLACGGMLAGGWLTDRLTRSLGRRWGRSIPAGVLKVLAVAAMLLCPWLPSAWAVTVALAVMAVVTDLGTPALWSYAQDTGGEHVGSVLGWGNMWGNIGAGLSPVLLSWVHKQWDWDAVFYLVAATFAGAAVTGSLLDSGRSLFPREENPTP